MNKVPFKFKLRVRPTTETTDCLFSPECENTIKPGSLSRICSACKSGLYYWSRKPLGRRLKYKIKLTKLQARLTTLIKETEK